MRFINRGHPFLDEGYARSYATSILLSSEFPIPLIEREIKGSGFTDAQLPWPYVDLHVDELKRLTDYHSHVISLVGVLLSQESRGYEACSELRPLKIHYIFDPCIEQTPLSSKSRSNLTAAQQFWRIREGSTFADWSSFKRLYGLLVSRRHLSGSSYDFPPAHFDQLARLPSIELIGVHDGNEWGAMICAARGDHELHMIHLVASETGMKTNATYALMQFIIDICRQDRVTLFMGGVPSGDSGGVKRFKARWSNRTIQSWLLQRIVRPDIYASLSQSGNQFFPAYRTHW